ncbi:MAG TPA: methyl-accepting chemotaxis protein [Kofleriaceae bacterium]|nr:methyl-accepting chemotaxis protein [Kofleriaceae bacterium]
MISFKRLRLSTKLFLLIAVCLVGFGAYVIVSYRTMNEYKVNGPVYTRINDAKDIVADVLPPPEYIIEPYLVVLQAVDEPDERVRATQIERLRKLKDDPVDGYDARHQVWVEKQFDPTLKQYLVEESYKPAMEFWDVIDKEFIPDLQTGKLVEAKALATGKLKDLYNTHRAAIDKVVVTARKIADESQAQATSAVSDATTALVVLGLFVTGLIIAIGFIFNRIATSLTRRIAIATDAAAKVAGGDLTTQIAASEDDETGRLLGAIRTMTQSLNSLVTRVKKSSIELMSTATQFSATNKQQEATVNGFGASTSEIAAAVREISATSQELLSTIENVNKVAGQTAGNAEQGRDALATMGSTMQGLGKSTASISSKLSVIREKAADINVVVTTITKVADQTNLLSVNAAIEAEKAGEYGLGFIVLAREIRRLADQTAVATLDIEQMVRQMQAAVSAGVMEMDKFTEEVRRSVDSVGTIGGQLQEIIDQVQSVTGSFESVAEAMRAQSQGARQINDAMVQLTEGARQTASSLKEFNSATDHLRDAVGDLKQEISHFTVTA